MGIYSELNTNDKYYSVDDTINGNVNIILRTLDSAIAIFGYIGFNNQGANKILYKNQYTKIDYKKIANQMYLPNRPDELYWVKYRMRNNLFDYDIKDHYNNSNAIVHEFYYSSDLYFAWNPGDRERHHIGTKAQYQYKWVDPSRGELYRPLVITPPVMINLEEKSMVFADEKEKAIKVIVKAGKDSVKFDLSVSLTKDWGIRTFESKGSIIKQCLIAKKGEEHNFTFYVTPPAKQSEAMMKFTATVDGIEYSKGIKEIKYDHIPIQTWFPDAEAKLVKLDIKTKSKHIGYIPGAGDEVIQCLQQLGYEVTTLTDEMLSKEDLSKYDAIITGVRAYNTNDKLSNFKPKLMDYVSNGGNLIVQYNTNNFIGQMKGDFGPYPFKITRDRVTDENAKVNFELPNHPVLNTPNKITDKDFEGWIQERCIYTASDSTGKYEMPLSMADPGEKPNKGSLIITKHGKGNFIYTGLVFFRELPAGVPGAYRLFVNMIELGK
ncbi:MAG: LmbE family protein, partial [Bacteroidia bacterium]